MTFILPALENSPLKCLRGLGAPPSGIANIGLANTAKADQALDNCGTLNCEAYIPLTLEISTDAQSLIGFGVVCEGYICYPSGGRSKAAQAP